MPCWKHYRHYKIIAEKILTLQNTTENCRTCAMPYIYPNSKRRYSLDRNLFLKTFKPVIFLFKTEVVFYLFKKFYGTHFTWLERVRGVCQGGQISLPLYSPPPPPPKLRGMVRTQVYNYSVAVWQNESVKDVRRHTYASPPPSWCQLPVFHLHFFSLDWGNFVAGCSCKTVFFFVDVNAL